jgi:hypothetical protein
MLLEEIQPKSKDIEKLIQGMKNNRQVLFLISVESNKINIE